MSVISAARPAPDRDPRIIISLFSFGILLAPFPVWQRKFHSACPPVFGCNVG
jgi:hypothetical protein